MAKLMKHTPYLLLAALLLLGCGKSHDHDHDHDHDGHNHAHAEGHDHDHDHGHESAAQAHSAGDIILDQQKAKAAGVVVSEAKRGTFHDVILTSGSLVAASCDETTIVANVSGIVDHAQHISEGMPISQGTTIYTISAKHLQDGDPSARARVAYLAAKAEYDRALPLLEDKIISERDFSALRTAYESARLAYEATAANVSAKGVQVKSPVTGYMKQCLVKAGDYVEVGTPLMIVTKNQHLYLRAEVPARYYSELSKIRSAKFRTQYSSEVFDLSALGGTLMSAGKSTAGTSSYVPVTFQLDNKGGIVPGSYAEVFLITGEREGVLSLPTSALTEEQGVYYVYLQKNAHTYHKQEVRLGATDGEYTEILSGISEGSRVVTQGAINVKLAAASAAIPAHNHSH